MEIFSLICLLGSKAQGTSERWDMMKQWDWPRSSSSVLYNQVLHWDTLWCHPESSQVSCTPPLEWWPIKCLHVECCRGWGHDFPKPCRRGQVPGWRNRALGRVRISAQCTRHMHKHSWQKEHDVIGASCDDIGHHMMMIWWCKDPNHLEEASEPKEASSLRVMAIAWRHLLPAPPGFRELQDDESELPTLEDAGSPLGIPWGCSTRPKLLRVYASSHQPKYLDGGVVIPLPDQGHLLDISTSRALPDHPDQPNPHDNSRNPEQVNHSWTQRRALNQASTHSWNWIRLKITNLCDRNPGLD